MGRKRMPPVVRFRHQPGRIVAGLIVSISSLALAAATPWLSALALLPFTWTVAMWWAGTDAGPDGLQVRALLGRRRIPWSQVSGLGEGPGGRVSARLVGGGQVTLTAVNASDLPGLVAASGQELARPGRVVALRRGDASMHRGYAGPHERP